MRILSTERLWLREFVTADSAFVLRLLNEPSFMENIADRGVRSLADAAAYLDDGPLASYARHGFGLWLMADKSSGKPAGMCGLLKRDTLQDVDIGYALLPEFCGQGLALEAASAVLAHARTRFGLERIVAIVKPANTRSVRLLQKLGFVYERMLSLSEGAAPVAMWATNGP
jgi:RimJ/RimL family protein N-acetyltransferase